MDEKLREYIKEFGGKQGGLEFLRDHDPELAPFIPPAVTFKASEGFSARVEKELGAMCKKAGHENVIVRASVRGKTPDDLGDFDGIVDKVDSKKTDLHTAALYTERIIQSLSNSELLASIQAEGKDFVPEDTTIAISPTNPNNWSHTLTEHPNRPGVFYDDDEIYHPQWGHECKPQTLDGRNYYSLSGGFASGIGTIMNPGPERLVKFVQERARLLLPDTALQFEYGNREDMDLNLFQMKALGPLNHTKPWLPSNHQSPFDELIAEDRAAMRADQVPEDQIEAKIQEDFGEGLAHEAINFHRTRVMGSTSQEGLELTVCEAYDRRDFLRFERDYPGVEYIGLLHYQNGFKNDPRLRLDEQTQNMVAYFSTAQFERIALVHQHTRFVMDVLKRGGVAAIGEEVDVQANTGDKINLKADGHSYTIEKL